MTGNHSTNHDEQYDSLLSVVPYNEDENLTPEEITQRLKEARKIVARRRLAVSPDNFRVIPKHNHFTRDIKTKGVCPACDRIHDKT